MEWVRGFLSAPLHSTTEPLGWRLAEGHLRAHPLQSIERTRARAQKLRRDGVAMPPGVPVDVDGVDQTEADRVDVLAVDEPHIALAEDRHVADPLERTPAAHIQRERGGTNLHHIQLGAGVPRPGLVTGRGDPPAPVLGPEDHEPADGVAHDLTVDVVEAGVSDELALTTLHHVDAPTDGRLVAPLLVEPFELALLCGGDLPAQVARDTVVLHSAVLDERRHIIAPHRGKLNLELTSLEKHDGSEHRILLSARTILHNRLVSGMRSNDRKSLRGSFYIKKASMWRLIL